MRSGTAPDNAASDRPDVFDARIAVDARCGATSRKIALPVEPLGDGLDHEVGLREAREIAAVVGGLDRRGAVLGRERRRFLLGETRDGFGDEAIGVAFLGRQVVEHHWNASVGEVRGDLGAHHASAEDGGLANQEWRCGHGGSHRDPSEPSRKLRGRRDRPRKCEERPLAVAFGRFRTGRAALRQNE